jgi:hypothetical protein
LPERDLACGWRCNDAAPAAGPLAWFQENGRTELLRFKSGVADATHLHVGEPQRAVYGALNGTAADLAADLEGEVAAG